MDLTPKPVAKSPEFGPKATTEIRRLEEEHWSGVDAEAEERLTKMAEEFDWDSLVPNEPPTDEPPPLTDENDPSYVSPKPPKPCDHSRWVDEDWLCTNRFCERGGGEHKPVLEAESEDASSAYIDWKAFWDKERQEADWAFEEVLARGRGHSIFAGFKIGKSELTLWIVLQLVRCGFVVIYLDYEMTEDDLYDRLGEMGCDAETDLSLLRYALLPTLPPLDTADGGKAVFELVDAEQQAHPDRHIAVIIDTIGRAVDGDENPADTMQDFYRYTGIGLKRRGVTWARLDHSGYDPTHPRGSTAKGDDVDVVWRLVRTDGGTALKRIATRMSWVPEEVIFQRVHDPLRYLRVAEQWPAGTKEVADLLDTLGIALDASANGAMKALKKEGKGRRKQIVIAALRWRRRERNEQ